MNALSDKRCLNHRDREAAARCPSCREFYCRECVTEHEGRVVCAKCLAAIAAPAQGPRAAASLARPVAALAACLLIWVAFYVLGRTLLLLPDAFHEGTIWGVDGPIVVVEDQP